MLMKHNVSQYVHFSCLGWKKKIPTYQTCYSKHNFFLALLWINYSIAKQRFYVINKQLYILEHIPKTGGWDDCSANGMEHNEIMEWNTMKSYHS